MVCWFETVGCVTGSPVFIFGRKRHQRKRGVQAHLRLAPQYSTRLQMDGMCICRRTSMVLQSVGVAAKKPNTIWNVSASVTLNGPQRSEPFPTPLGSNLGWKQTKGVPVCKEHCVWVSGWMLVYSCVLYFTIVSCKWCRRANQGQEMKTSISYNLSKWHLSI